MTHQIDHGDNQSNLANDQMNSYFDKMISHYSQDDALKVYNYYSSRLSQNQIVSTLLSDYLYKIQVIYNDSQQLEIDPIISITSFLMNQGCDKNKISLTINKFLKQFGAKFMLVNEAYQEICQLLEVPYRPVFEAQSNNIFTQQEPKETGPYTIQQLADLLIPLNHDIIRDIIQAFVQNVNLYQNSEEFQKFLETLLHIIWIQGMNVKQFFRSARIKSLFVEIMKLHFNVDHTGFQDTTTKSMDISDFQPYAKYLVFLTKYQKTAYDIDFNHLLKVNFDGDRAIAAPKTPPPQIIEEPPSPELQAPEPTIQIDLAAKYMERKQQKQQLSMQKQRSDRSKQSQNLKPGIRFSDINSEILNQPLSNDYEGLVKEFIVRFQDMQLNQFVDEVWALYRMFISKGIDSESVLRFMERVLHPIWQQCLINKSRLRNGRIQEVWKALQLETRDRFYVLMVRSNMSEVYYDSQYVGGYTNQMTGSGSGNQ